MKKESCVISFCFIAVLLPLFSYSQYIVNGNATQESCNCYQLTQSANQVGSVWQSNQINLDNPFDFSFNVFLGCLDDDGADGIAFVLQTDNMNIGSSGGGGLGFAGMIPSIGVTLDTYQNIEDNDPAYDHISIQANGNVVHGSDLAGPIPASSNSDNIEDCNWHVLRIKWDPATHTMSTYF